MLKRKMVRMIRAQRKALKVPPCPLCRSNTGLFASDKRREYFRCPVCRLIFVPPAFHLSRAEEKQRYDLHENTAADAEYVGYLSRFLDEVFARIPFANPHVLDFGAGRHAVMTELLNRRGIRCTPYDPLYGIGEDALSAQYDIAILCEVMEHLRDPRADLDGLRQTVSRGGHVVVRTELWGDNGDFSSWWYVQDMTHVNFFCRQSIRRAADILECRISFCDEARLTILAK
jgi:hypothetical protein